tara:strand:+ start:61 stop:642 length:582 start_codon:yes stop_codon:yes gene_type:complete
MGIVIVNLLGFLLAVILIRRIGLFSIPRSEILSSKGPFTELCDSLGPIASGAGDLDAFLDSSGKPLADERLRYPRPEDSFKTVGACFRWLASQPRPTEVTQAVSIVRALYQVGHSTGAPARSIDRAVEVVAKVVRGMAPFGSSVEEVRKPSRGDNVDREWMLPIGQGSKVARPLGFAVKVNGSYVAKAEVACS